MNGEFWNLQARELATRIARQVDRDLSAAGETLVESNATSGEARQTVTTTGQRLAAAIAMAYRRVLGREPTGTELQSASEFLAEQRKLLDAEAAEPALAQRDLAAFSAFCLVLLNLNEFVYVD